jgi:hypothetical protein
MTPRIRWLEVIIGFPLLAGGVAYIVAFAFFAGPDRHDPSLQLIGIMSALWAFLGGLSVVAKMAQWRLGKQQSARTVG